MTKRYKIGAGKQRGNIMELTYVDSKSLDQIGFDEDAREAHVIFKGGRHYVYSDVSIETWKQFRIASSKGTFVNEEFKAKGYPCRKL
jgi:hypothetical protein